MQQKKWIMLVGILLFFWQCQPEKKKGFVIQAQINGGAGKYIKIIDMTMPGLGIDSIELDLAGRFVMAKESHQPHDYVFYFTPEHSIRVTPLPEEQITLSGNTSNLLQSHEIVGSPDSESISKLLKDQQILVAELDSVKAFYMRNQKHPNIDSIISLVKNRSDSIFLLGKTKLQNQIKSDPKSLASYVALAQKLGPDLPYFSIQKDYEYFYMVDTALMNRFDSAMIVNMLHGYVVRGKQMQLQKAMQVKHFQIGDTVPDIALPNPKGDTVLLSSLKGKYVLLDFWGSWCRPCRLEHPNLTKAYWRYRKRGFDVYQVALEHTAEDWKNTIREDKLYWKTQVSELRYMDSKVARQFQIKSIPANFLLDPKGRIVAKNLYGEELLQKLEELMPYKKRVVKPVIIKIDSTKSE